MRRVGHEFEWNLDLPSKLTAGFTLGIDAANLAKRAGGDHRDLAFVLLEIQAQH